jgi:hypothetical protein
MPIWYMRDDHTFAPLPLNIDEAMEALEHELSYYASGMLCARHPWGATAVDVCHAHYDDLDGFRARARDWLALAIETIRPKPINEVR